jgi:hypothetical protein
MRQNDLSSSKKSRSTKGKNMNSAFVLRLTWDSAAQSWRILIKPTNGGPERVFIDLESAFLYIAQLYTV